MNTLAIGVSSFPLIRSTAEQEFLAGHKREVVTLTMEASYQQAVDNFVEGAVFTIYEDVIDESGNPVTLEHYHDDYPTPGAITDNRDGTVVVKMGAATTREQDLEDQAEKVSQSLVTLAGKSIQESDVAALRLTFEAAAAKLSDSDAKIAPSLTRAWTPNEKVSAGSRRYYAPNENLYEALRDHVTSISTFPDTATDYWKLI